MCAGAAVNGKNKAHAGKDNGVVGMYRCRHLGNRLV